MKPIDRNRCVVVVAIVAWVIGIYNGLARARIRVKEAWSGIDVQLKRRIDLIPNLVETVKGYAAHEKGTLDAVISARNAGMAAATPQQQASMSKLGDTVKGLAVIMSLTVVVCDARPISSTFFK